jgi:hypothetical protein
MSPRVIRSHESGCMWDRGLNGRAEGKRRERRRDLGGWFERARRKGRRSKLRGGESGNKLEIQREL